MGVQLVWLVTGNQRVLNGIAFEIHSLITDVNDLRDILSRLRKSSYFHENHFRRDATFDELRLVLPVRDGARGCLLAGGLVFDFEHKVSLYEFGEREYFLLFPLHKVSLQKPRNLQSQNQWVTSLLLFIFVLQSIEWSLLDRSSK